MPKYVVFQHKNLLFPVILPDCATHSMLKMEEAVPVSAGFFEENWKGGVDVSERRSESLNLGPKQRDKRLLELLVGGVDATTAYMLHPGDEDYIEPSSEQLQSSGVVQISRDYNPCAGMMKGFDDGIEQR